MKAMILAAGRGERMRPLTDHTPKPLLPAGGKPIIVHTIEQLVAAGIYEIVINHAHLGSQLEEFLGNGQQFGASISYSPEGEQALETAGGIIKALPLLGKAPFLVVNGDIATDFPFARLKQIPVSLAHLVFIDNPEHHPEGDFALNNKGLVTDQGAQKYTFSGIGLYRPELFDNIPSGVLKLRPLFNQAIAAQRLTGQKHDGFWMDIGTPERLQELDDYYNQQGANHA